jgi:hypothetical protein
MRVVMLLDALVSHVVVNLESWYGKFPVTRLERSRWRGGRFACYAPRVMPQRNSSNHSSRTCSFSKHRKTNSLQMGKKIEFP